MVEEHAAVVTGLKPMATTKQAVAWQAKFLLPPEAPRTSLQDEFDSLLKQPTVQMTAALWCMSPEEVAVQVLKAAERKVPRDWLSGDKPTGIYHTRGQLLDRVWMMVRNQRLTSEIARSVALSPAKVDQIISTGEGVPSDLELQGHHRGKVRRGLIQP